MGIRASAGWHVAAPALRSRRAARVRSAPCVAVPREARARAAHTRASQPPRRAAASACPAGAPAQYNQLAATMIRNY